MFQRKSEAGRADVGESVIALHSQQHEMSMIPPVYLKNGPNLNRKCTNLGCCAIFMLVMGAFGYFYFQAYTHQHVKRLSTPVDAVGLECDEYPYLYFVTPDEDYLYRTVCVKECPHDITQSYTLNCRTNAVVPDCKYNASPTDKSKQVIIYNTQVFGNNICLPVDKTYQKNIQNGIVMGDIQQALINIKAAMPIIAISAAIAFGLALVLTLLLGLITTCITWLFLLFYIAFTSFLSFYFFLYFIDEPLQYLKFPELQEQQQNFHMNWYIFGISATFGLLALYALFNVCMNFTRIKFMISLIKLATKFLYRNKSIIFVPIVFFFLVIATIFIWVASSIFILSQTRVTYEPGDQILPFQHLIPQIRTLGDLAIALLGLIWLRQYLLSFARFLTVSSATVWYFTANSVQNSGKQLLAYSMHLAFRYHNGSIIAEAIYSFFFLWISRLFNSIYDSLHRYRMKRHSQCLHYLASCTLCLCCTCEHFIMYINNYAFVQIVMTSHDYFESSKAVYFTIKRNYQDFDTLSGLGDTFTHFGKMFIFLVSSLLSFMIMTQNKMYNQMITHPLYPCFVIAFVTLSIATLFMDMFGQTADAIILAYFTDCEVEKFHFGRDDSSSCPSDIRETVMHIRQKRKIYYG